MSLLRLTRQSVAPYVGGGPGTPPAGYLWLYDETTGKYDVDQNGYYILVIDPNA